MDVNIICQVVKSIASDFLESALSVFGERRESSPKSLMRMGFTARTKIPALESHEATASQYCPVCSMQTFVSAQFLFDEVMEYQDAFEAAVSILTGREVRLMGKAETEKEFRISPELRKSRLDSVAMDESRRVYPMEMQKRNTKNLRRRSRLYQGHVDVSMMAPGTVDFNSLNDVCQIMVTPFDIFGRKLYRYTFVSMCVECPDLYLGDGAWRIFINTKGKNPQVFTKELLDFMKYITRSTDARAEAREKGWKEGRAEGRSEGRAEGRVLEIYSMIQDGDISLERAAKRLGITIPLLKDRLSASGYQYPETEQ